MNLILFAQYKECEVWFCNSVKRTPKEFFFFFSEAKTEQLEGKTAQSLDLDGNFFGQVFCNFFHFRIHVSKKKIQQHLKNWCNFSILLTDCFLCPAPDTFSLGHF